MEHHDLLEQEKELAADAIQRLKTASKDNEKLEEEVKAHEKEIQQFKHQQKALQTELTSKLTDADEMESDLITMTRQYQLTYEQLEQTKALEFSLNDANIQVETFRAKYNQACAELSKLSLQFTAYKSNNQRLEQEQNDEIVNLSVRVEEMEEALLMTQNRFNNTQILLKEKEAITKRLEFEVQQNSKQLEVSIGNTAAKEQEMSVEAADFRKEIEDLNEELGSKDAEIIELNRRLKEQEASLEMVNVEYEEVRKAKEKVVPAETRQEGPVLSDSGDATDQGEGGENEDEGKGELTGSSSSFVEQDGKNSEKLENLALASLDGSELSEAPEEAVEIQNSDINSIWEGEYQPFIVFYGSENNWALRYERIETVNVPSRALAEAAPSSFWSIGESAHGASALSIEQGPEVDGPGNESVVYLNTEPTNTLRHLTSSSNSPEVEEIGLPLKKVEYPANVEDDEEASESHESNKPQTLSDVMHEPENELAMTAANVLNSGEQKQTLKKRAKSKLFDSKQRKNDVNKNRKGDQKERITGGAETSEQPSTTADQIFNETADPPNEQSNEVDTDAAQESPGKRKFEFAFNKKPKKENTELLDNVLHEESESTSQSESKSDAMRKKKQISDEKLMDTPVLDIDDQGGARKARKKKLGKEEVEPQRLLPSNAVRK